MRLLSTQGRKEHDDKTPVSSLNTSLEGERVASAMQQCGALRRGLWLCGFGEGSIQNEAVASIQALPSSTPSTTHH
jgi:hypothetical protein